MPNVSPQVMIHKRSVKLDDDLLKMLTEESVRMDESLSETMRRLMLAGLEGKG